MFSPKILLIGCRLTEESLPTNLKSKIASYFKSESFFENYYK